MNRLKQKRSLLFLAALLFPVGMAAQQNPSSKQATPAPSVSPEDAELQALRKEQQRLLKVREIENLRRQNAALQAQNPPVPALPVPPLCVPAPPAKPCGWLCREEKRLQAKAEAAAQKQVDKGTEQLGKATHGSVDGGDAPSVRETVGEATQPPAKPCPAGYVPAKPAPSVPAAPVASK